MTFDVVPFTVPIASDAALGTTITVNATAEDTSGNAATATPLSLVAADLTAPAVAIVNPLEGEEVFPDTTVLVRLCATDNFELTEFSYEASGVVTASASQSVSLSGADAVDAEVELELTIPDDTAEGTITLTAHAKDGASNVGDTPARTIFVVTPPNTTSPKVVSISPRDQAERVQLYAQINVFFSEPVLLGSELDPGFTVAKDGTEVTTGVVTLLEEGTRARFSPDGGYELGANYVVSLSEVITNQAGYPLIPFTSSFTTAFTAGTDSDQDGIHDGTENELGTDPNVYDDFPRLAVVIDGGDQGRTVTIDEPLTLARLTLTNGAVVTHSGATTEETYALELSVGSLTIDATSAIDVSGKGYLRQTSTIGVAAVAVGSRFTMRTNRASAARSMLVARIVRIACVAAVPAPSS
jgi:hypothetical protein